MPWSCCADDNMNPLQWSCLGLLRGLVQHWCKRAEVNRAGNALFVTRWPCRGCKMAQARRARWCDAEDTSRPHWPQCTFSARFSRGPNQMPRVWLCFCVVTQAICVRLSHQKALRWQSFVSRITENCIMEKDVWTRSCESNYIIWMTSHLIAGQTRPRKRGGPAEVKLLQTLLKRVFLPQCQRRVQPATSIAWLFWNIQLAACVFGTKPSTLLVACVLSRTLSEPRDRTRQMATQTARQHTVLSFNPFWAFLRHALFSTGLETQDRRDWCRDSDWNASATSFSACLLTRHLWYTDCTGYSRGSTMAAPRGPAHQAVAARPNGSNCFGFNLLLRLRPWNRHGTHTDIFASSGIQTSHSDGCTSVAVSSPCGILHH